ncbi:hypothetical protein [Pengzhenrongella frigida]|uniref:Uncharacterized protein n=1 Tax=Pengzhenrongella frigida TaxID=1259133 RepID=A0A4Q5N6V0_9MICO|nr:hypothetical protein [Cellulomonas sp. HLT2-17]RYV52747.1 hypothetical protein EUA98_02100 [Cellulomonas sp. HLT2-17]
MADKKKMELGELLKRLTVTGNVGTDSALFRGVAVSYSETALHLSTNGGIVEIPLAEIEDVSEIGGHPNAVAVNVKDSSTVRLIRIETGDAGGASMVATALLRAGDGGGTIPSGPYPTGTRSTRSIHDNIGNDFQEVVIDDWNNTFAVL